MGVPFEKGKSGNPGGRPKDKLGLIIRQDDKLPQEIIDAVKPLLKDNNPMVRVKAAEFLSDRGYGKARQSLDLDADVNVNKILIDQSEEEKPKQDK